MRAVHNKTLLKKILLQVALHLRYTIQLHIRQKQHRSVPQDRMENTSPFPSANAPIKRFLRVKQSHGRRAGFSHFVVIARSSYDISKGKFVLEFTAPHENPVSDHEALALDVVMNAFNQEPQVELHSSVPRLFRQTNSFFKFGKHRREITLQLAREQRTRTPSNNEAEYPYVGDIFFVVDIWDLVYYQDCDDYSKHSRVTNFLVNYRFPSQSVICHHTAAEFGYGNNEQRERQFDHIRNAINHLLSVYVTL